MHTVKQMDSSESMSDEAVVTRVLGGDVASFEILMRRHNQRLYRVACGILQDRSEAEDVIQDAYVRAYEHLNQFAGRAKFSTWLSRIAVNEALARKRHSRRYKELEPMLEDNGDRMDRFTSSVPDPEQQTSGSELRRLLENAIGTLPDNYRAVLVLRDVEEMDTAETALALEISEENVKTRLHRARALLKKKLYASVGVQSREAFPFHAVRCDRVVKNVFERIQKQPAKTENSGVRIQ